MKHYKAHFQLDNGVSFTLDVQLETKHYSDPALLDAEMEGLAARLGARFMFAEFVALEMKP